MIFQSNGLLDKDMSVILKGAKKLDNIKTFIYKNNDFQM